MDLRWAVKLFAGQGFERRHAIENREFAVPGADDPRDADFKEASTRLNEGLKTCRAVVENYRSVLGGDQAVQSAANDDSCDLVAGPSEER